MSTLNNFTQTLNDILGISKEAATEIFLKIESCLHSKSPELLRDNAGYENIKETERKILPYAKDLFCCIAIPLGAGYLTLQIFLALELATIAPIIAALVCLYLFFKFAKAPQSSFHDFANQALAPITNLLK